MRVPPQDEDNPWILSPDGTGGLYAQPMLHVETIKDVEPLDAQIGAFPKKIVPNALNDALFGRAGPTSAELVAARGNAPSVSAMQTYAILDAAKVTNLPELLERSTLEHRCLFKGTAYDEMKDVAPWIVRLEGRETFTRYLFTRSDAPWHLWDAEPGIYVLSHEKLDDLWRHFRKFTRLKDESAKWLYWRFWEPEVIRSIVRHYDESELFRRLVAHNCLVTCDPILSEALIVSPKWYSKIHQTHPSNGLTKRMLSTLHKQRRRSFSRKIACEIAKNEKGIAADILEEVHNAVLHGFALGMSREEHLRRFVFLSRSASEYTSNWFNEPKISRTLGRAHDPARLLVELEYDLIDLAGTKNE